MDLLNARDSRFATRRHILSVPHSNAATLSLLIASLVLACVSPVGAELIHGYASFNDGGYDFSEQQSSWENDEMDVVILFIFDPPLGYVFAGSSYHSLYFVPDSTLNDITEALADTMLYGDDLAIRLDGTYVVRTIDGLYAKFQMLTWDPYGPADFEYCVQMDGSRNLDSSVPTRRTTWGRLKALYSQ